MRSRVVPGRKLLVASIGVAAVSYVACSTTPETSGNLVAPPVDAAGGDAPSDAASSSGNLMPPPPVDASRDGTVPADASDDGLAPIDATSGNLMPPDASGGG